MFWILMKSRFTEASIDQTCYFKMPTSFKPKAQVAPQCQMSEKEIKKFYTQGFLGPFDAFSARRNDGLQARSAGARKRKEQDLRLGHAARSAFRIAAACGTT